MLLTVIKSIYFLEKTSTQLYTAAGNTMIGVTKWVLGCVTAAVLTLDN